MIDSKQMKSLKKLVIFMILIAFGVMIYIDTRRVKPLGKNDPELVRLATYAKERGLNYSVSIPSDGQWYCASLSREFEIVSVCQPFIGHTVSEVIDHWNAGFGQVLIEGQQ